MLLRLSAFPLAPHPLRGHHVCVVVRMRGGGGAQSSGIVQLLLFNYAPFSSQLKDHDIIIT